MSAGRPGSTAASGAAADSAAGRWRAVRTDDGSWTLAHPVHGETCHSTAGAWTQARLRYASVLRELPERVRAAGRVRLLDVGTGLGLNLGAALEACEQLGLALDATSLELDGEVVRAARALREEVPYGNDPSPPGCEHHARVLAALEAALGDGRGEPVELRGGHAIALVLGDARATLPALAEERRFDAVFLDPFSPRVDPALWEPGFLREVARRMDPLARLSTYSVSLRARAGLARAGLEVGAGPRVGRKAAGTLAARGGSVPPLDPRTRRRLDRALGQERLAGAQK